MRCPCFALVLALACTPAPGGGTGGGTAGGGTAGGGAAGGGTAGGASCAWQYTDAGVSSACAGKPGAPSSTGAAQMLSLLPGGLLAVSSNSGVMSRDEFTFVPEGSARLGLHITNYVSVFVGYTFLYWFDVARPTDQIDRTVNPTLVPANLSFGSTMGPARPAVNFQKTDFWAQGISFGFEVRY